MFNIEPIEIPLKSVVSSLSLRLEKLYITLNMSHFTSWKLPDFHKQ